MSLNWLQITFQQFMAKTVAQILYEIQFSLFRIHRDRNSWLSAYADKFYVYYFLRDANSTFAFQVAKYFPQIIQLCKTFNDNELLYQNISLFLLSRPVQDLNDDI